MIFLLAYLYVHCVIFLSITMHMHIELMNTLGNWLISDSESLNPHVMWSSHGPLIVLRHSYLNKPEFVSGTVCKVGIVLKLFRETTSSVSQLQKSCIHSLKDMSGSLSNILKNSWKTVAKKQ